MAFWHLLVACWLYYCLKLWTKSYQKPSMMGRNLPAKEIFVLLVEKNKIQFDMITSHLIKDCTTFHIDNYWTVILCEYRLISQGTLSWPITKKLLFISSRPAKFKGWPKINIIIRWKSFHQFISVSVRVQARYRLWMKIENGGFRGFFKQWY